MAGQPTVAMLPLTKRIFFGKVDLEKSIWVGHRHDVTNDAIIAVGDYINHHGAMQFTGVDGREYVLEVKTLEAKRAEGI